MWKTAVYLTVPTTFYQQNICESYKTYPHEKSCFVEAKVIHTKVIHYPHILWIKPRN